MSKTVAIVQSNYIPWKGYFDMIGMADEFILYDHVQYTRRDWRNRNRIKTPNGAQWLTIPVKVKGRYFQSICEVEVSDPGWPERHWKSIAHNYARAPYFPEYRRLFEDLYMGLDEPFLSKINFKFIQTLCRLLGITTKISWSTDYDLTVEGKTESLIHLCQQVGATTYLSGPAAQAYIDPTCFENQGIQLVYMDYSGYPTYPQLYPPFDHHVSILDLLFHTGPDAPKYMKSNLWTHQPSSQQNTKPFSPPWPNTTPASWKNMEPRLPA